MPSSVALGWVTMLKRGHAHGRGADLAGAFGEPRSKLKSTDTHDLLSKLMPPLDVKHGLPANCRPIDVVALCAVTSNSAVQLSIAVGRPVGSLRHLQLNAGTLGGRSSRYTREAPGSLS
jgi:hypothetical protein